MKPIETEELLRKSGVTPLIRATRNQLEIDYLPPYGDPEVSIPGEVATYVLVGAAAAECLERIRG